MANKRVKLKQIDEVSVDTVKPESFFNDYILTRTPCKFKNNSDDVNSEIFPYTKFQMSNGEYIQQLLEYEGTLMVEEMFNNGFGNGNRRVKMRFGDLVEKFKKGEDGYYLTTQYEEHDEDKHSEEGEEEEDEEEDEEEEENSESEDDYDLDKQFEESIPKPETPPQPAVTQRAIPEYNEDDSDSDEFDFDNLKDDYEPDGSDQEPESDPENEDSKRLAELFQPPLTALSKQLPLQLLLFNTLVPQQINMWMGYKNANKKPQDKFKELDQIPEPELTPQTVGKLIDGNGTSSGLHHDHSDNLYILVSGIKRFTLFSPFDAYKLYTVGNILNIYENGVINYKTDECAPNWNFINDDGSMKLDNDEKAVLNNIGTQLAELDPPNFSKIPPLLLHLDKLKSQSLLTKLTNFTRKYFPDLIDLDKYEVWLHPGDMLYLPSSWFHEVSSFPDTSSDTNLSNVHLAINYWFAPPNTKSYSNPYKDDYWYKDFEITKKVVTGE